MAKSIRSKWKRKCRAIKRERYGKKELERLQKTLTNDPFGKPTDVDMTNSDLNEIVTVVDKAAIKPTGDEQESDEETKMVPMEMDGKQRVFNLRTMKDQNGTYPVWMHPRKIHKHKKSGNGKIRKKKPKPKSKSK